MSRTPNDSEAFRFHVSRVLAIAFGDFRAITPSERPSGSLQLNDAIVPRSTIDAWLRWKWVRWFEGALVVTEYGKLVQVEDPREDAVDLEGPEAVHQPHAVLRRPAHPSLTARGSS